MRRFSRIAIAVLGLIAASIACDSDYAVFPAPLQIQDNAWSPDSKKIAVTLQNRKAEFVTLATEPRNLYQIRILDVSDMQNAHTDLILDDAANPSWSPDGHLIFSQWDSTKGWQRKIANADGSNRRIFPLEISEYFVWSHDGKKIAATQCLANRCYIRILESDQQNNYSLISEIEIEKLPLALSWSFDNTLIAYSTSPENDTGQISIFSLASSEIGEVHSNYWDHDPMWMPNDRIAFISDRDPAISLYHKLFKPTPQIYSMNTDGSDVRSVVNQPSIEWFDISPDGTQIAFTRQPNKWLKDGVIWFYERYPDGTRQLKYSKYWLYIVNSDGTRIRNLGDIVGSSNPIWSPDSQYLAFYRNLELVILDADSGTTVLTYNLLFLPSSDGSDFDFFSIFAIVCASCLSIGIFAFVGIAWFVHRRSKRRVKLEEIPTPLFPGQFPA